MPFWPVGEWMTGRPSSPLAQGALYVATTQGVPALQLGFTHLPLVVLVKRPPLQNSMRSPARSDANWERARSNDRQGALAEVPVLVSLPATQSLSAPAAQSHA